MPYPAPYPADQGGKLTRPSCIMLLLGFPEASRQPALYGGITAFCSPIRTQLMAGADTSGLASRWPPHMAPCGLRTTLPVRRRHQIGHLAHHLVPPWVDPDHDHCRALERPLRYTQCHLAAILLSACYCYHLFLHDFYFLFYFLGGKQCLAHCNPRFPFIAATSGRMCLPARWYSS